MVTKLSDRTLVHLLDVVTDDSLVLSLLIQRLERSIEGIFVRMHLYLVRSFI